MFDFKNKKLKAKLSEFGFSMRRNANKIYIEGTGSSVAQFMAFARGDSFSKEYAKECEEIREHIVGTTESEWKGGTYSDLLMGLNGSVDMTPYNAERDSMRKSGFEKRIREKIAMVSPRRTRFNSEHDGEWSMDRKWDNTPFNATRKALGAGRTIEIVVNLCASAAVSPRDFDRFGAMVWAVSDLIEAAGIQTRITTRYATSGLGKVSKEYLDAEILVKLKESTQFVTPSRLAACFKTVFFRRAVFGLFRCATQLENGETFRGLGHADNSGHPIKFNPTDGKLTMTIGTRPTDVLAMEKEILAAIGSV